MKTIKKTIKNKYKKPKIVVKKIKVNFFNDRFFEGLDPLLHGNDVYAYPCASSSCTCLPGNIMISTPIGSISIKELKKGDIVWTINSIGEKKKGAILKTIKILAPKNHKVIHLVLEDGRELFVSLGHPTAEGNIMGKLKKGDILDGTKIIRIEILQYNEDCTYDILSSGETGNYWANNILIGSTLSRTRR